MRRLILGDGLLGSELVKQTGWDYVSRKKDMMDLDDMISFVGGIERYDEIINCIAHTDTYDKNKDKHWDVNYKFVVDLVNACSDKKLIHISTDYVYSGSVKNATENDVPVHNRTWYGYTKLLSDSYVQLKSNNYLLIRCGHKEKPFKYEKAFTNMVGNFDYVDKITSLIIDLIKNDVSGIKNVGTKLKSMYTLAKKSNSNVGKSKCNNELMPKDVSMRIK
tara:strand:+ start:791 stop:1450 length:660 start_codon:yes stop_codon:yes gene_type:complete